MTIQLPTDLEDSVTAAVESGRFGSADELVAQAVRSLLDAPVDGPNDPPADPSLGSIGFMRDAADELDAIVAEIYRRRPTQTLRVVDDE